MAEQFGSSSNMSCKTTNTTNDDCAACFDMNQSKEGLMELLGLDVSEVEKSAEIVNNLLQKGRQILHSYQDDIIGEIYEKQMQDDSELLQWLKKYHQQKWKAQYDDKFPWFRLLVDETEREAKELYDGVLTRTAEYGDKYMKSCSLLSIVIQLLFESLDDNDMSTTFHNIWNSLTNDGLQSITTYSDYILPETMNKQLNKTSDQKLDGPLFMALREYYRDQLFQILQESKILNRANLYEQTLDSVAEHGWITGITMIEKKTTKKSFNVLMDLIKQTKSNREPVISPTPVSTSIGNETLSENGEK